MRFLPPRHAMAAVALALSGCADATAPERTAAAPPARADAHARFALSVRDALERAGPTLTDQQAGGALRSDLRAVADAAALASSGDLTPLILRARTSLSRYAADADPADAPDLAAISLALESFPSNR